MTEVGNGVYFTDLTLSEASLLAPVCEEYQSLGFLKVTFQALQSEKTGTKM